MHALKLDILPEYNTPRLRKRYPLTFVSDQRFLLVPGAPLTFNLWLQTEESEEIGVCNELLSVSAVTFNSFFPFAHMY